MNSSLNVPAMLDSLTAQQQRGENSLRLQIRPDLIEDAMNLPGYRKLFVPVVAGAPETAQIDAARLHATERTILVLVQCQSAGEFRKALGQLPLRTAAEWRSFSGEDLP